MHYSIFRHYVVLVGLCCLVSSAASAATWTLERGWLTARDGDTPLLQATDGPAAAVDINDAAFPADATPELRQEGAILEAIYTEERGELLDRYEPIPALGPDAWLRTLTYTNRSSVSQDLTAARMRLAPLRLAGGQTWRPQWFWMTEAAPGRAVCLSYKGSTDYYHLDGDENWTGHAVNACWRLAPGQQAVIGAQGVWLGAAGREEFRAEARRWYAAIDLHIPTDSPAWINDTILYECSAGGHIDSRFSDVGGFDRLATQSEYLAGLGITTVWLQAVHKHKSPPDPLHGGWNLYDPLDMLAVDDILGGPKALKRLTKSFRKQDLRVIGELVPHGGHSVQALALPQWWTCGRDGKPANNWGGCGMDYSSPEWQAVQRDVATLLARDFGMVGARIDVADGSGVNWTSPRTNHASYSTLAGSVEMLRAIHEGFAKDGVSPLIIPENGNFPEHFAVSPVAYGHSTWMVMARELPSMKNDPARMVKRLRDFFENERGSYPPGGRVLRTLNNHDSVCEDGRVQYRYGAGLARALYGVCLMIEGIPLLYQEEEVGSYDALRALNLARRAIPEFADGAPDYLSIDFAPEVFSCLRSGDGTCAVGLSNLSGKTVSGTVALPIPLPDGTPVFDGVSGLKAEFKGNAFTWTLAPYATALLHIGEQGRKGQQGQQGQQRPERSRAEGALSISSIPSISSISTTPTELRAPCGPMLCTVRAGSAEIFTHRNGNKLEVTIHPKDGAPEITILHAERWKISGRTALLSDRAIRRHFPFPAETNYAWDRGMSWIKVPLYNEVAPTGRLWESILEPLHPQRPAMAFEAGDKAVLISDIQSTANNIVLTDRTDEADPEPYGLTLRFHAADPDLNPRLRAIGLGQPWEMATYPDRAAAPQELRFTLTLATAAEANAALEAERLPIDRGEAQLVGEGNIRHEGDIRFFIEPGKIEWTHLATIAGRHRIRLELRHSQAAPDGADLDTAYEVRINGEVVPLEWTQRNTFATGNAFFGYAMTPPMDLQAIEKISILATKPWCGQRGGLWLEAEWRNGERDED